MEKGDAAAAGCQRHPAAEDEPRALGARAHLDTAAALLGARPEEVVGQMAEGTSVSQRWSGFCPSLWADLVFRLASLVVTAWLPATTRTTGFLKFCLPELHSSEATPEPATVARRVPRTAHKAGGQPLPDPIATTKWGVNWMDDHMTATTGRRQSAYSGPRGAEGQQEVTGLGRAGQDKGWTWGDSPRASLCVGILILPSCASSFTRGPLVSWPPAHLNLHDSRSFPDTRKQEGSARRLIPLMQHFPAISRFGPRAARNQPQAAELSSTGGCLEWCLVRRNASGFEVRCLDRVLGASWEPGPGCPSQTLQGFPGPAACSPALNIRQCVDSGGQQDIRPGQQRRAERGLWQGSTMPGAFPTDGPGSTSWAPRSHLWCLLCCVCMPAPTPAPSLWLWGSQGLPQLGPLPGTPSSLPGPSPQPFTPALLPGPSWPRDLLRGRALALQLGHVAYKCQCRVQEKGHCLGRPCAGHGLEGGRCLSKPQRPLASRSPSVKQGREEGSRETEAPGELLKGCLVGHSWELLKPGCGPTSQHCHSGAPSQGRALSTCRAWPSVGPACFPPLTPDAPPRLPASATPSVHQARRPAQGPAGLHRTHRPPRAARRRNRWIRNWEERLGVFPLPWDCLSSFTVTTHRGSARHLESCPQGPRTLPHWTPGTHVPRKLPSAPLPFSPVHPSHRHHTMWPQLHVIQMHPSPSPSLTFPAVNWGDFDQFGGEGRPAAGWDLQHSGKSVYVTLKPIPLHHSTLTFLSGSDQACKLPGNSCPRCVGGEPGVGNQLALTCRLFAPMGEVAASFKCLPVDLNSRCLSYPLLPERSEHRCQGPGSAQETQSVRTPGGSLQSSLLLPHFVVGQVEAPKLAVNLRLRQTHWRCLCCPSTLNRTQPLEGRTEDGAGRGWKGDENGPRSPGQPAEQSGPEEVPQHVARGLCPGQLLWVQEARRPAPGSSSLYQALPSRLRVSWPLGQGSEQVAPRPGVERVQGPGGAEGGRTPPHLTEQWHGERVGSAESHLHPTESGSLGLSPLACRQAGGKAECVPILTALPPVEERRAVGDLPPSAHEQLLIGAACSISAPGLNEVTQPLESWWPRGPAARLHAWGRLGKLGRDSQGWPPTRNGKICQDVGLQAGQEGWTLLVCPLWSVAALQGERLGPFRRSQKPAPHCLRAPRPGGSAAADPGRALGSGCGAARTTQVSWQQEYPEVAPEHFSQSCLGLLPQSQSPKDTARTPGTRPETPNLLFPSELTLGALTMCHVRCVCDTI
ncbi:hypothetical protein Cadr_000017604 [Camelus dromedarius]|uniref:Uncharacterized protein n=1 Tax=Camelus dromedarius TaxID=9838 RepID=A0A5N4DHE3_CAMDR|nr:hypothetical protein Cadr_000017604 [Camelus dromedarius]